MLSLWEAAREAADDARFLYSADRKTAACNRAYYAMFNAARALLIQSGIKPERAKTHATVLRLFSLKFVKDGPFDAALGHALREAARVRNQGDYAGSGTDAEALQDIMTSLESFMDVAGRLIRQEDKLQGEGE